jgi:hypothetical protein
VRFKMERVCCWLSTLRTILNDVQRFDGESQHE